MRSHLSRLIAAGIIALGSLAFADVPKLISYQAQFADSTGVPLDTTLSITFRIFQDESGTIELWSETHTDVPVIGGLVALLLGSIVPIDYDVFDGSVRYLGITLGADVDADSLLPIVSMAYAYRAVYADTSDYALAAPGAGGYWTLNDEILTCSDYWAIARGGAGNTLYGDSARTMVNLGVGSEAGLNGQNYFYATVGGGQGNKARHNYATVAGGWAHNASGEYSTIGGGRASVASGNRSTVSGGNGNLASGTTSIVCGGGANTASGNEAAVVGGWDNDAIGWRSFAGGGSWNKAVGDASFAGSGQHNYADGAYAVVAGGSRDTVTASYSGILGGDKNWITDNYSAIAGGSLNQVHGRFSAILGGRDNTISASGDYSYLFGISSALTSDSTFMVDMPHIRFGDESDGYELPTADGTTGQILVTNGAGLLNWSDPASASGLTFPYYKTVSLTGDAFTIQNTGGGTGIKGQYHTGPVAGPYNSGYLGVDSCGVLGISSNTFDDNYGVYGKHYISGNFGYIAGNQHALFGKHSSGSFGYIGGDGVGVYGNGASGLACQFDGTSYFNGSVGVGTQTPADKLHVAGSDGAFVRVDGGTGISGYRINENNAARWILFFRQWESNNLIVRDEVGGRDVMTFESNTGRVGIGTQTPEVTLDVAGTAQCDILEIEGGSDIAEPFSSVENSEIKPGMVMVIDSDNPGKLRISRKPYDRCVAGIVSGAGDVRPGVIMGRIDSESEAPTYPLALTGRAYCFVDASEFPVRPGDLLTTSATAGCAMRAVDSDLAQGAIIGKAMTSLDSGTGLVLVLVSLQ